MGLFGICHWHLSLKIKIRRTNFLFLGRWKSLERKTLIIIFLYVGMFFLRVSSFFIVGILIYTTIIASYTYTNLKGASLVDECCVVYMVWPQHLMQLFNPLMFVSYINSLVFHIRSPGSLEFSCEANNV
jgi:hypothetical protein